MRWFGEPWPSAERRAPVCEDDKDKIPTPNAVCFSCEKEFDESSQGVELKYLGGDKSPVVYMHIDCMTAMVIGTAKLAGYQPVKE